MRMRVIGAGLTTWIVLVLALDVFVFLSLRDQLHESLDELLATRAQLVHEMGATLTPEQLDARLTEIGVPAIIQTADGRRLPAEPASPGFGDGPPGPASLLPNGAAERVVSLPDGSTVTVLASTAGIEHTLDHVLIIEAIGSVVVLVLMLLLLLRMSKTLLGPIDHVVRTARHIASGRTGERLAPDRPDTELGRMAAAFDEMLDSLEEALDKAVAAEREAREAEQRSQQFLADAAHQLRTPLAALRASVESLVRTEGEEAQERILDNLGREAARTSKLVTSLLRVAELDRGAAPMTAWFDLAVVLREELVRTRDLGPTLEVTGVGDVETIPVAGDADGIREALANLLDNARRHAETRIMLHAETRDGHVEVRISDDGPGVKSALEERIFDRFASFDGAGGSGLGLPIARAIAQAHGGDVTHRAGAFVLTLPITGETPARAETAPAGGRL